MNSFIFLVQKLQMEIIPWGKKIFLSNDFIAMLCFILGVYGERFFLNVYALLGEIPPKIFSCVCLICSYYIIIKFSHN